MDTAHNSAHIVGIQHTHIGAKLYISPFNMIYLEVAQAVFISKHPHLIATSFGYTITTWQDAMSLMLQVMRLGYNLFKVL